MLPLFLLCCCLRSKRKRRGSKKWSNHCTQWRDAAERNIFEGQILTDVILIFTFSQLFVQVLRWVIEPNESTIIFNEEETIGSVVCLLNFSTLDSRVFPLFYWFVCSCVAFSWSNKTRLFHPGWGDFWCKMVALIVLAVIAVVAIMTDAPTMSPNVRYLICQQGTLPQNQHWIVEGIPTAAAFCWSSTTRRRRFTPRDDDDVDDDVGRRPAAATNDADSSSQHIVAYTAIFGLFFLLLTVG